MLANIATPLGFVALLLLFTVGAIGALLLHRHDHRANVWGSLFAIAGSVWGVLFAIAVLVGGNDIAAAVQLSPFPLFTFSVHIDKLSAFFLAVISLIALFSSTYGIGYVKHYYKQYSIGALGFFYNLFIAGMLLVVSASNGIFFLVAWELMSLASYFLVVYDRKDAQNVKAGFLYLVMTHVGTAFIIIAFLLLYTHTGSFDFAAIKAGAVLIPASMKNAIFILAMVGFGTKAGIIPFHIWLPSAHPAAPSHVSALMSGVMIKTGIFMMIRLFLDILQPVPAWWGLTVVVIGLVSTLLGVLYALTEHDIKRLLAYSSIENIGIILLGVGSALTFTALGMQPLALIGLVAALFHTLNHATFKSLLFLSAGSVINQTHTRNMEEYGGLMKYMPQTALFFLVGAMAISALPPFNGFFSEWLTFQALFQGIAALDFYAKWIFILAAGSLAFTGGLALACFVKAFGATFLARPRSIAVTHTKESSLSLRVGMAALAVFALVFGVFSGRLTSFLNGVGRDLQVFHSSTSFISINTHQNLSAGHFAFVSPLALFVYLLIALVIVVLGVKYLVNRKQKVHLGATWDCGTDLSPRMEVTATGFSHSIVTIFQRVLRPSIQHDIEYRDDQSRYLPKSRTVTLGVSDLYHTYIYNPIHTLVTTLSERTKHVQGGNINVYLLYIFIALLAALVVIR